MLKFKINMDHDEAKKLLSLYKNLGIIEKLHIYIRLRRQPFDKIEHYIPEKGRILDFGCGHGFFSLYLEKTSNKREIVGLDISLKKIKAALKSKHSSQIKFICDKKARSLDKKNFYDAIVVLNVLYLLKKEQQGAIINKYFLALRKGGRLIIAEQDANHKISIFWLQLREFIMQLVKLTSGETILFQTKSWWLKTFKNYFLKVESIKINKSGFNQLYICTK